MTSVADAFVGLWGRCWLHEHKVGEPGRLKPYPRPVSSPPHPNNQNSALHPSDLPNRTAGLREATDNAVNTFTARAGCESRRPHGSLRPAPCEPPAPGQNRPAGPRAALSRAVAAARHAAAVFLVVVAGLLAVSTAAQAQQTTTTFVYTSNSNQSWSGAADGFQAQSVMTGPNSAGYLITQVRLDVDDINTAGLSTVVKIRENSASDEPGNLVATLTHSGNLISSAFNTFTVPSNTRLDPNTTYWITVNEGVASDRVSFSRTRGHGEFSFPDTGWRIGDSRLYRSSEMDDWSSSAAPFLLEVRGPPHVSVAIEPNQPSIVAGSEDLVFTLTRVAAQPDELEAKVTIVQDQSWLGTSDLEHTVTFTRFVATASLTLNASSFSSDPDTAGDLTATVSGDRILGGSTTVEVTVDDDETASAKLTLSVDPPSVSEDAVETEVTVTGTLDGAPLTSATEVAVTVGVSGDTATEGMDYATVGELTLTIEAGATEGTTTFALTPTDDAVDEDDAETLSVTGTTAASGLEVVPTAVTIADDDARGVTVSAATLTVPEEGSNTYTVVLRSAPTADVTVTPSLSTGSSPEVSVSPATLTFTPGNWATAQTVTVEADQDDDAEDDEATVEHEVSGGDYGSNGVTAADVAVTVDDDETASAKLTLSVDPPSVSEDAVETEVTVTGTLDGAPLTSATEVAVTVGVSGDTATEGMDYATVGELTLTIEAGATEGTTTFALTPTDDAVDEDDAETLSVTGTTAASGLEVVPTAVTIADDDARGVTVSAATLTVPEEGSNTYTVVLRSAPTADVTVTPSLSTGSSPEVSVSPATLTFTPGNWATAQTVTVEADQDDDAEDDEATVEHEVSGGDYGSNGVTAADVAVTVDDDETASAKLTLSVDPPSVSEDAVETEVTVTGTLDGAPLTSATEVAVTVGVSGDTATEGMDYATVGELTLTIEAGATEGTTTFALTPTDDAVDEDDAETLSVTGTTAASGLEVVPTAVTIADDDARGVTVSAATLTVPEEGSNTYTVVLRSAPTADVTVTPSLSTGSSPEVSVSPVTLTFTPGNWATAQTVTVEADQDDDAEDDEATVEHEVSGGDYGSNGVTAADVAVTVDDDETASAKLTLSVDPPSVSEDAVETEVTVTGTLDGAPLTSATEVAVTVGVSGDTATEGMDYATVGELTLTIEAGATEGTTTFALTPTDDAVDEDDAETLSVTGTTAASGLEVVPTAVTIADDDARGVTVSAATLTVPEEGSNTYTVVLRSAPTADVTVTPSLSTGSSPEVSVSPATLTFTPGNWATAQTVTVEADQDDDAEDDEATVEHEVSGGDYGSNGVTAADVAVTVDDDETEACVLGTDVWCATLTVKNLGSGNRGCANSQSGNECSNTSHLTEDEFTHDMTDYTVTSVQVRTNEELRLWISRNLTAPTGSLVLVVGSERFSLARADTINDNNRRWDSSRLSWSTGDTVELRLVEGFPPLAPAAPRVNGIGDNDTSLKVTWGEPNNAGRPPITHYDLRYRETGSGSWQSGPQGETGPNATIGSLTTGAEYDVQVRASNADGNGEWSPSGQGTPGVVEETIPNGKLQLVDKNGVDVTNTTGIGRLEVRLKGEWGTVCEDRFDSETFTIYGPNFFNGDRDDKQTVDNIAPELACQLMGKATGEMVTRPGNISIAPESQKIWLDDVRCAAGSTPESTPGLQHCYHAGVGLHNCRKDHMREDVHLQCTGTLNPESATQEEEAAPLTASFEGLPETHDGATAFTFRLVLSADIANSDGDVRDSAFQVTGGTVTGASRVDGRSDLWEITVTPDGTGNIGIVLMADRECGTAGALCTGDGRALTTALLVTVAEQPGTSTATTSADEEGAAHLTAQFVDVPAEHDGENEFSVELRFSEPPAGPGWYGARNIAVKRAIDISGGTVVSARSIEQNGAHRRIVVQPSGNGPVTLSLPPGGPACDQAGALCTEAGGRLETGALTRIRGPAALSVADAEVQEGPGAALAFSVTLDRATSAAVQVDYATRDGTAQAGSDYTANSGTLNFAPGETAKTVTVAVLDDSHDEGSETLTLVLSNPSGAYLADGEAVGTIENSDLMPQAWLSRFGRTVAEQVLEAVEERIRSAPQAGVQVTVAGQRIGTAAASDADVLEETEAQARLEDFSTWLAGEAEARESRTGSRSVAPRELLTGSSFALTTRADGIGGGLVSLWGRGALTRFDGREGRTLAVGRGDRRAARGGLDARPRIGVRGRWLDDGPDAVARPGRGQLPGGEQRQGLLDGDRALPLRAVCADRPCDGVGQCGLRRGRADADAGGRRGAQDRHGPHDGGGGAARHGGRGATGRRAGACGEDRRDGGADLLGGNRRRRGRQPRGGGG